MEPEFIASTTSDNSQQSGPCRSAPPVSAGGTARLAAAAQWSSDLPPAALPPSAPSCRTVSLLGASSPPPAPRLLRMSSNGETLEPEAAGAARAPLRVAGSAPGSPEPGPARPARPG